MGPRLFRRGYMAQQLPTHFNWKLFQSARPRGARPCKQIEAKLQYVFQSARPRGARRQRNPYSGPLGAFQSARPRGARPMRRDAP